VGFAALALILGVAIFTAAGSLSYWRGWVYLLVFLSSAAAITVYLWRGDIGLLERRVNAGPAAEQERSQQLIQSLASVAFLGIIVVPALDHRFGWSTVPLALSVVADVLVAFGFWIVFRVFRANTFTAGTIGVERGQAVISSGPYALVRHPMYAGALLMLLATPLALGSWWGLLAFVPMLAAIVWRLRGEEELLSRQLPGYAEYRQQVRKRLIPGVW
ncbi:MAG: isoprenylcysteine carboxylmethyltransferase family protein, partial [Chloroflexi bacterium]|nr:isoprenylcysteine carboxylmethyltransferase family protein [Chloroflexota bacterium]